MSTLGLALRHLGILLLIALGILASDSLGIIRTIDTSLSDLRFDASERHATGKVVLVDIDARSLAEVGMWPWPRHLHGDLVRIAAEAGAAQIAFDVDFSAVSHYADDEAFADALTTAGIESFLAAFVQPDTTAATSVRSSLPIDPLLSASWPAAVNVPVDEDGRVRRFPRSVVIGEEAVASMPAVLAGAEGEAGEFGIDHGIAAGTIPRVSYVDLLRGRVDPAAIAGKSLIVGASAIELHDLFRVPSAGIVSGATVIALATETLLQSRTLEVLAPPTAIVLVLLGCGFLLILRLPMWPSLFILAVSAILMEVLAVWVYRQEALMMRTGQLHLVLCALAIWSASREFDLRRLLLRVARTQTQNTQKLLERVVDDGFDAVLIIDEAGRIVRSNEEARLLLGLPEDRSCLDPSNFPSQLRDDLRRSLDGLEEGRPSAGAVRGVDTIRCGSNDRIIEYSISSFWMGEERQRRTRPVNDKRYAGVMLRDVTDRERASERLRFAALHDSLTGLSNRRALEAELNALMTSNVEVTLLAFDLDRFKGVNDALGHATGDAVLVETARRAATALPQDASLFRIGGDEFMILLRAVDPERSSSIAQNLTREIARPFHVHGHRASVGTSVGIATNGDGCRDASALRRRADVALYQAKRSAKERIVTFDLDMERVRLKRLALENDLKQAIESDAFEVVYQPQARLTDGRWTGAEALVRWYHPERGFISPADFIPVAEEMGLIHELGSRVLKIACSQAQSWPMPIKIAVNVSPLQFAAGDIVAAVRQALLTSGLDPRRLEIEITESAFVGESAQLSEIFDELLALGVTFALDDFGTGYSSLGYLHRFPISKIKIDRSFVMDIPESRHSMAVVRSVMALAEGVGIRTIAEGIETQEQAELLDKLGCQEGQGYLFSKPVGSALIAKLLSEQWGKSIKDTDGISLSAVA